MRVFEKSLALLVVLYLARYTVANGDNHNHGNHEEEGINHEEHGHNQGSSEGHDPHGDHDHETHDHTDEENSGHDHAGNPHGHGTSDEDCPNDMNHGDGHNHAGHNHEEQSSNNHEGHSSDNHAGHNHVRQSSNNHENHEGDSSASNDHAGHNHEDHSNGGYDGKEGDCPDTAHEFNGKDWYIELMNKSPKLKDITLCTFATTNDEGILSGVIASIHPDKMNKNLVVVGLRDKGKSIIRVIIEGQFRNFKNTLPANKEVHMCIVTSTETNKASFYINGNKEKEIKYHRINGLPSGRVRIGRMKDDKFPMYTGRLRNFMIWNKMLTAEEIKKIYSKNHCPSDAKILLMAKDIVPLKANVPIEACPGTEYNFDNTGDHVEYLELNTVPDLKFLTVCAQVTTNAMGIIPGTIASYSTKEQPDALSVGGEMDSNGKAWTRFSVAGQTKKFPGQFMPNTNYRMCLVYHLQHNHLMTYINGRFSLMVMFDNVNMLPGGGTVIVGQRQRKIGGCFDRKLAYTGKLTDFMIWTRAFSLEDIAEYTGTAGNCPTDAALTTNKDEVIPHGMLYSYGKCPKTKFTLNNQGNVLEYISVAKTLPTTNYLTVCGAVTTDAKGMIPGAVGSYSTESMGEAIIVAGERSGTTPMLHLTVNGKTLHKTGQFMPRTKYNFCISYHSPHNHALTFIDGQFNSDFHFHDMGPIEGGGKIIVGQAQGCPGGCFECDLAYTGKLDNFMVWNRALSAEEIMAMKMEDKCPTDQIVDLTKKNVAKVSSVIKPE